MNRKQLRQIVCGSAVVAIVGGSLLGQATGAGGFMSRIWDRRPKLSQTRLNPGNWFGDRQKDTAATQVPEPVVSVRPELTRNPFDSSSLPAAVAAEQTTSESQGGASPGTDSVAAQQGRPASQIQTDRSSDESALPVITAGSAPGKQARVEELPPPSIDAVFKRVSPDMVDRARRRKSGASAEDRQTAGTTIAEQAEPDSTAGDRVAPRKTLLQMPVPDRKDRRTAVARQEAEPVIGRVRMGELASDDTAATSERGYVRLEETMQRESSAPEGDSASRQQGSSEGDSAYERLLAQVKGEATETATPSSQPGSPEVPVNPVGALVTTAVDNSLTGSAPRLPDSIDLSPSSGIKADAVSDDAGASGQSAEEPAGADERGLSIDEMIARSRARMENTPLAQQAQRERNTAVEADSPTESRLAGFAENDASAPVVQQPLTVPKGFNAGSFRTYGERTVPGLRVESNGRSLIVPTEKLPGREQYPGIQSWRSLRGNDSASSSNKPSTPSVVPGRSGSGVVIESPRYSTVKPRVTSNGAPSISVPNNSGVRRLSYERSADSSLGDTRTRLQNAETGEPILMIPGEAVPPATATDSRQDDPRTGEAATSQAAPAPPGSRIEWPDESDLAPVKPQSGGTSWGLIVFCLAILAAGGHIAACRFRQSRTAETACKS